jgi:nicotinamidase-related amidase
MFVYGSESRRMSLTDALLVMDFQNAVVNRVKKAEKILATVAKATAAARAARVPVIYVRVAFREGSPEVSAKNMKFSALVRSGSFNEADEGTLVNPAVAPLSGDITITKRRTSAFSGSDLDVVLRALGVDSLVLTGIATSGVVLSTLRQASDLDFRITVLRDGCVDGDEEVHRVLMDKVFPRQATVIAANTWIEQVDGTGPT